MINILLVDDHKVMRDGLKLLLEDHSDMNVVGEADHGRDALTIASQRLPDVVVMDIAMPELNGIETTRRLLTQYPHTKVVALSMYNERKVLAEMLQAGASALVVKGCATQDLVQAIRAVHAGQTYIAPEITCAVGTDFAEKVGEGDAAAMGHLTRREQEVLQLVAEGGTTKSIGTRLDISAKTVDTHRQNIMRKLNLRTVAELTKYAVREGITTL